MFPPNQNTGKGRRASRSGKAQRISSTTWIGMVLAFLFIGSFVRFGPVLRPVRADEPQITIYKLTTASIEKGCFADDALAIKINDKTINTNLTSNEYEIEITPGPQTIKIAVPGKPNVKVSRVVVLTSEEDKRAYDADAAGVATVPIDKKMFQGAINVFVYLTGLCAERSNEQTSEEVRILVYNRDCQEGFDKNWNKAQRAAQNYEGWQVKFGEQRVTMGRSGWAMVKLTYEKDIYATYEVSVIVPNERNAKLYDISYNDPQMVVGKNIDYTSEVAQDYLSFSRSRRDYEDGDVDGVVKAQPHDWWANRDTGAAPDERRPAYMVLAVGDIKCQEVDKFEGISPTDFSVAKVLAVKGKAEIIAPGDSSYNQVRVNDSIAPNSTIRIGPGASIILESKYGHLIITEDTEVQANLIMTASGREKLEALLKWGKIQIKRVTPEPSSKSDESTGMVVRTPTATITDKETIYTVSHDEKTNVTTVGVEEGKVEVTPVNSSLKPVTLAANQQVQVSDKSVSAVTHYSGESTRATRMLRYVGISAAALLGLLVVVGVITFLYRRVNRAPAQPASQQSGIKVEAAPAKFTAPAAATNEWRCPNPQCGKLVPTTKKFCTACGTRSGFKVEATPAYVAPPAVATREQRCPNPQCGRIVAARKKFCSACGASVI